MQPQTLFRRQSAHTTTCFFCQSPVTPQHPKAFKCPHCHCWNRFDAQGVIISDDPAMYDEEMNVNSFNRRASPNKDALPTMYGNGPFCHTCQTNQMLLVHLLSNYIPSPEDPEYEERLESLPEYRESLHIRYPPVCANCRPAVEDEIRRKDNMARVQALGGWLKNTKGKDVTRRVSGSSTHPNAEKDTTRPVRKLQSQLAWWKFRGVLWAITFIIALVSNFIGGLGYRLPNALSFMFPAFPVIVVVSVFWTFWDHTYSAYMRAKRHGRDLRVIGKYQYHVLQTMAWLSRLTTACILAVSWLRPLEWDYLQLHHNNIYTSSEARLYFIISAFIELSIFFASVSILKLRQPPVVRLIDTNKHEQMQFPSDSRQGTPGSQNEPSKRSSRDFSPAPFTMNTEDNLLSTLTFSSRPVILSARNPIFGVPSMAVASSSILPSENRNNIAEDEAMDEDDQDQGDEMDWTPTVSSTSLTSKGKSRNPENDSLFLRPQTFYAPEQPTGLEYLFERTKLIDGSEMSDIRSRQPEQGFLAKWKINWWIVYGLAVVPLAVVAFKAWEGINLASASQRYVYTLEPWDSITFIATSFPTAVADPVSEFDSFN